MPRKAQPKRTEKLSPVFTRKCFSLVWLRDSYCVDTHRPRSVWSKHLSKRTEICEAHTSANQWTRNLNSSTQFCSLSFQTASWRISSTAQSKGLCFPCKYYKGLSRTLTGLHILLLGNKTNLLGDLFMGGVLASFLNNRVNKVHTSHFLGKNKHGTGEMVQQLIKSLPEAQHSVHSTHPHGSSQPKSFMITRHAYNSHIHKLQTHP